MTDQKSPGSVMSDIELPDLPSNILNVLRRIRRCENEVAAQVVLEHALRAYAIADREKRAQAAQPTVAWLVGTTVYDDIGIARWDVLYAEHGYPIQELVVRATEASKPVQAEEPHVTVRLPGITAKQAAAVSIALCEALVDAGREFGIVLIGEQPEAPSDDADPLTPEQEEWVMDLAEKHNLGRRVPQIGALRGVAPDVFYTDASYRTHELFCFAAELLAAKQAGREPVASIYVSPNGEREFDDWGHDLPVGRNELCLATKQAEAPTASNAEREALQGLLEIEEARIATGAFTPNAEGMKRIETARAIIATQPTASNAGERSDGLRAALQDITDDYADRFDLDCPSTNPGIKHVIRQARAALAQVPEQVAGDSEDAENYRWLCKHMIVPAPSLWDNGVGFVTPALPRKSGAMTKPELDAAIRAARTSGEAAK